MAHNKNQHYVPKGLLKPFTKNEEGISLEMLLIRSGKIQSDVSVSSQCSKPYFYGSDPKLENAIQAMETQYGVARNSIVDGSFLPKDIDQATFLNRFILFQHYRTLSSLQHNAEAMVLMREGLSRMPGSDIEPLPDERTLTQFAMRAYVQNMPMLDDLAICLIRNETDLDFVVGDNPVVHTNRWQLQRMKRQHFGPGHAGAIFFLPISPRVAAMGYDGDVYHVPKIAGWLRLSRRKDADVVNMLQFSNARAAIYFSATSNREAILSQYRRFQAEWPQRLRAHTLRVAQLKEENEEYKEYLVLSEGEAPKENELLVHVQQQHAQIPTWPKFLKYRSKPTYFDTNSGRGQIRHHTRIWHNGVDWA
ncbi:DUF4238 domain-containing protein [Sphingopyxis microcysteis]|uniref:DUF4238 domain-containing protein n=1 Tax=Sphingopyxis microcysteis TaxID=2484145 RepID=UPI0014470EBD|nr:DUF4238 domain-containing protein [Sphingopyxis microcysteis]